MTMIGEDSNAVPTGGLPEIIRISSLAGSRISARIRYRRGQRAVRLASTDVVENRRGTECAGAV